MSYKKISLSIAATLILGTFSSAQTQLQTSVEFEPNSIIAYFSEDGTLLPTRNGSEYYRYFKEIVSGCYLVQDFYSMNDQKQTDPICFTDPMELQSWFPQSMQGPLTFWDIHGNKMQEGYSQQDGGSSGFWKTWDNYGNANTYELINGEVIVSYFDPEGNRQAMPVNGGTFRTILDQNPETGEYLVADYFTDSRMRQMDPVIIQREDLLSWDIKYRHGTYTYYNDEGDLTTVEQYDDGKLNGTVTNWYPNVYPAQKFDELHFTDGQQDGLYIRWYDNGYPKIKAIIDNGNLQSLKCWDSNFHELNSTQCPALFDEYAYDNTMQIEEETINIEENGTETAPIEIIIPGQEVIIDELESTIETSDNTETSNDNATVIFPKDQDIEESTDATESPAEPETEGKKILKSIKNIMDAL
ncbi:toxin-antitoxin system YwqK family antitoxin [Wohlfahrtiimonas larvae]|uniref:Toxin-antitoxin system YwqK family antitoxin n=1 Tax=Wohlfahrtiimonas larvae TaxID=1157986 RepID=A0ABP9MP80_9GAMM|nr:hypothetical protein [Wohlfahrtiimonas larvae]